MLLDTFHMNIEEADIAAALSQAGRRLGYVHFADSNRRAPGQGHIDFMTVVRALSDIGYTGVVSAEILPVPDDATAVRQAGDYLTSLLTSDERRVASDATRDTRHSPPWNRRLPCTSSRTLKS